MFLNENFLEWELFSMYTEQKPALIRILKQAYLFYPASRQEKYNSVQHL